MSVGSSLESFGDELVEEKKKDTERDDQIDGEGSEERAENADEEEEKHQSEAKTLPTTEVSSSATGAEEDLEVVTITGLTEGTDDDPNVDEIQRLEFDAAQWEKLMELAWYPH